MARTPLGLPVVGVPAVAPPLVVALPPVPGGSGRRFRLHVLDVGLACCAVEVTAAELRAQAVQLAAGRSDASGAPDGTDRVEDEPHAAVDVVVVSGTVTDALAPAVRALVDARPERARVVSFGACATTGGPYWDSYSVTKGVDTLVDVDLYVPGCPPRPEALLDALVRLDALVARQEAA